VCSTERCDATSDLAQFTNVPYLKTFAFSEPATAFLGGGGAWHLNPKLLKLVLTPINLA